MGLFDIFKKEKPSKELKDFADKTIGIFNEVLKKYDFRLSSKKVEEYFCTIIYTRGNNYIKIFANIHWHDYPSYYNIMLGEGKSEGPDQDWNSIALWHIKKHIDPTSNAEPYSLLSFEGIEFSLVNASQELEKYSFDFLKGNLDIFKTVRSKINKGREPYKIISPNGDGTYKTTYDKTSQDLKDKNS